MWFLTTFLHNRPGEALEHGEMNMLTLPSRHSIRNSNPRARYLSVMEAPQNTESLRVSGKETFLFL